MQAKTSRNIQNGKDYDYLFPKAKLTNSTVKRGATVSDTVKLIPQVVNSTRWQTKELSELLRGDSVYSTCRNIWDFVYDHIRYHKDEEGREQIRSPARSWHDRERGVDCDCYTVFISTILCNLGIPHLLRITKYGKDYFQHIYPVVPTKKGSHITLDCVVDSFNHEEYYTEKKDTPMDLQFLEGLDDIESEYTEENTDELGKKGWFKRFTHKILHAFNRVNPVTVLLRNGVLACMKLNLFKVAQRLKYAYWSEADARAHGADMGKWQQLVKVKDKLENIFSGAGGKPENLKHAILTGKGNRNHDVNGLGYMPKGEVFEMDINTPLPQLLGKQVYESENSVEGLGDLGDPATGASIAAATGVMGVIAELIKKIGNLFPKKDDSKSQDFQTTAAEDAASANASSNASAADRSAVDNAASNNAGGSGDTSSGNSGDAGSNNSSNKQGFWEKNKKWLKPTLWGTGIAGAAFGGYMLFGRKSETSSNSSEQKKSVSGTQGDDLSGHRRKGRRRKGGKIKPVDLD